MNNKWKISYAAGRGAIYPTPFCKANQFKRYIEDMDFVSVREQSLCDYINNNTEQTATIVLDPTLLNPAELYSSVSTLPAILKGKDYVLLYHVVEKASDTIQHAVKYACANNLTLVEITDKPLPVGETSEIPNLHSIYLYDVGPEEWLGLFEHSSCVFTNSFHACCFSIIFHKEFFSGIRYSEDKVAHLLNMLGLSDRLLSPTDNPLDKSPIQYSLVNRKLNSLRKDSSQFILDAINQCIESGPHEIRNHCDWNARSTFTLSYESCIDVNRNLSETNQHRFDSVWKNNNYILRSKTLVSNTGDYRFIQCPFKSPDSTFVGYRVRIKMQRHWFWLKQDGSLLGANLGHYDEAEVFQPEQVMPQIRSNYIYHVIIDCLWTKKTGATIRYNSKSPNSSCDILLDNASTAPVSKTKCGSIEIVTETDAPNDGSYVIENQAYARKGYTHCGYRARIKTNDTWLCISLSHPAGESGSKLTLSNSSNNATIIPGGSTLPSIPAQVETIVFESVWKKDDLKSHILKIAKKIMHNS